MNNEETPEPDDEEDPTRHGRIGMNQMFSAENLQIARDSVSFGTYNFEKYEIE